VDLSVIIPAYNEAQRLPRTVSDLLVYLDARPGSAEIVVVENGSTDGTAQIAADLAARDERVRVLSLTTRGKGQAVRAGMLAAAGHVLLESDADASVPPDQIPALVDRIQAGADVAIGSREAPGARRVGEPRHRHLMGRVFNTLVRWLAIPELNDTQCGFKAFRREAAHALFTRQTITGWAFDIEVLFIARRLGYRIDEVPVTWYYGPSSRVRPVRDTIAMLRELLMIRANAMRGRYG
jgi:glycosyltransferase involved in cell wall biosynthesis